MSTKVDHIFKSCRGKSQLSPAIFRASRNHLIASKSFIYKKTPLFDQRFGFRQGQPDFWPHIESKVMFFCMTSTRLALNVSKKRFHFVVLNQRERMCSYHFKVHKCCSLCYSPKKLKKMPFLFVLFCHFFLPKSCHISSFVTFSCQRKKFANFVLANSLCQKRAKFLIL